MYPLAYTTGVSSKPSSAGVDEDIIVVGSINRQVESLTVIGKQHITGTVCIDEIHEQTLSDVCLLTKDAVEPSALTKVLDKIGNGSVCVTITGSPGEGKSTLGYLVLGKLKEERKVYTVRYPRELDMVSETASPVVLLDDIFGATRFNDVAWFQWKDSIYRFINMNQNTSGHTMGNLILIMRDFVLRSVVRKAEPPLKMFLKDEHVVNISRDAARSKLEKQNILKAIAKKYCLQIDSDTINTICAVDTPHGFPLTCKLFATMFLKDRRITAVEFFHKPTRFLMRSLKILMTDEVIEHIFVSMMKGNGHVSKTELARCGPRYIRTANDLCTYIKQEEGHYIFDHPSIFDTVAILLCETKLTFILEHSSMAFIKERLWLKTPDGEKRSDDMDDMVKLMAEVPWCEAEELVRRFVREIEDGNLSDVRSHNAWKSDRFVQLLIHNMTADQLNVRVRGLTGFTLLHQLCEEARPDCVKTCLQRGADVERKGGVDRTALHVAALSGSTECVRLLLEDGADVNHKDSQGRTALDFATKSGFTETVSYLRERGAR